MEAAVINDELFCTVLDREGNSPGMRVRTEVKKKNGLLQSDAAKLLLSCWVRHPFKECT